MRGWGCKGFVDKSDESGQEKSAVGGWPGPSNDGGDGLVEVSGSGWPGAVERGEGIGRSK